jgi:nuclear pore complex protein Nup155
MQMYQGYARPFRLYEPILLILKTADTRIEDVCEAVWRQLLREQPTRGYDAMKDAIMRDRLGDLVRRYYPSEAAPLGRFSF